MLPCKWKTICMLWLALLVIHFCAIWTRPPHHATELATIKKKTVTREVFVNGSIDDDRPLDLAHYPSAQKFLSAWNGDWRSDRVAFWTAGRDVNIEQAKALLFGSALEVDLLQGRENELPSLDDWYTCAQACSKTTLGMMGRSQLFWFEDGILTISQ